MSLKRLLLLPGLLLALLASDLPTSWLQAQEAPQGLSERQQRRRVRQLEKELQGPFRKWLAEDVRYIISNEERKAFVEERIAEDQRERDKLNLCLDDHEAGKTDSRACEKFMKHEITRGIEDRRLRRCSEAQLDANAQAERECDGLPEHIIDEEVQAMRIASTRSAPSGRAIVSAWSTM